MGLDLRLELTESKIAESIAERFRWEYRYDESRRRWLHWSRLVWQGCPDGLLLLAVMDYIKEASEQAYKRGDEDAYRVYERYTSYRRLRRICSFLKWFLFIEGTNPHPHRLNCLNGTLDLKTGELKPHDPEDLIDQIACVEYVPASPSRWLAFLERCLPDPEVRRSLQRHLGLALAGDGSDEVFSLWYGKSANKEVAIEVLKGVLGGYVHVAPPRVLTGSPSASHLRAWEHKRLIFVPNLEGRVLYGSCLRLLVGGGCIDIWDRSGRCHRIPPSWLIVGVAERLPRVQGRDDGTWRRIRVISWGDKACFEGEPEDTIRALLEEGGAILHWMYEGYQDVVQNCFWEPDSVREASLRYRREQDPFYGFVEERVVFDSESSVLEQDLYQAYLDWCELRKRKFEYRDEFRRYFGLKKTEVRLPDGRWLWKGLRLKE